MLGVDCGFVLFLIMPRQFVECGKGVKRYPCPSVCPSPSIGLDQLAKPTFRSRYAHSPSRNRVKDRWTQSHLQSVVIGPKVRILAITDGFTRQYVANK